MPVFKPGDSIGAYRILGELGRGGMARVYRALQVSLDREVALKALSSDLADDPQFLQRFTQEARAVARLHHPNIVSIYDYGEQDDTPFIVMELVEGGTLKTILGQPMDLERAARLISDVAAALDYAHRLGIVHRDVKPHNVLIAPDGHAVLSDFGIAKLASAATQLTRTGASIGTPEYMSPEQVKGEPATAASDVYSLGIVAFELATGRVPFSGDTPFAVMLKHLQEKAPPARQFKATLPAALEPVLAKALALDPADRYATATDFARAFTTAAETADPEQTVIMSVPAAAAPPVLEPTAIDPTPRAVPPAPTPAVATSAYPSTLPAAPPPAAPTPPPGRTGRTIASDGGLTVTLTPTKVSRSRATYGLVLRNDRPEPAEMRLQAMGHDTCEFTVPPTVLVPANSETAVSLGVRSNKRRWRGRAEKREFNLAAMAGGGAPMVVTGEFEDRPRNAVVAVGGAFAGLLLLIGLPAGVVLSRGGGDGNAPGAGLDATNTPAGAALASPSAVATATPTPKPPGTQAPTATLRAAPSNATATTVPATAAPPTATKPPATSTPAPTPTPIPVVTLSVTSAELESTLLDEAVTWTCDPPYPVYFLGEIDTTAPGDVVYYFLWDDGSASTPRTTYVGGDLYTFVDYEWEFDDSYYGWVVLVTDSPNAVYSSPALIDLTCE